MNGPAQVAGPDTAGSGIAAAGQRRPAAGSPRDSVGELIGPGIGRELGAGDPLVQGEPLQHVYRVLDGCVEVICITASGSLHYLALPGDVIGLSDLVLGPRRRLRIIATRRSLVTAHPFHAIRARTGTRPSLALELSAITAELAQRAAEELCLQRDLSLEGRVARQLLRFAGNAEEFEMPCSQTVLARCLGATRERVNRALARLRYRGVIAYRGHHVVVRNGEALVVTAGGKPTPFADKSRVHPVSS